MKKVKYLTDSEVDEITTAIYNDALETLYEDVSEDVDAIHNPHIVKELFEDKDIEYIQLEGKPDYIVLNDGRCFNTRTLKYVQLIVTGNHITVPLNYKRYFLDEVFEDNGWTFDEEEILRTHKNNKWKIKGIGNGVDKLKRA